MQVALCRCSGSQQPTGAYGAETIRGKNRKFRTLCCINAPYLRTTTSSRNEVLEKLMGAQLVKELLVLPCSPSGYLRVHQSPQLFAANLHIFRSILTFSNIRQRLQMFSLQALLQQFECIPQLSLRTVTPDSFACIHRVSSQGTVAVPRLPTLSHTALLIQGFQTHTASVYKTGARPTASRSST